MPSLFIDTTITKISIGRVGEEMIRTADRNADRKQPMIVCSNATLHAHTHTHTHTQNIECVCLCVCVCPCSCGLVKAKLQSLNVLIKALVIALLSRPVGPGFSSESLTH